MATTRKRNLLNSRRRLDDEGEDDESAVLGLDDDSQSDLSIPSDNDADYSEFSGPDGSEMQELGALHSNSKSKANPVAKQRRKRKIEEQKVDQVKPTAGVDESLSGPKFVQTADTDVMMNGFSSTANVPDGESVNFEDTVAEVEQRQQNSTPSAGTQQLHEASLESTPKQRGSGQVNDRPKKEFNPAMVPNRGGFFMHDHRNLPFHPNGPGFGRGRGGGRGRGLPLGGYGQFNPIPQPSDGKWDHDLHDTVANPKPPQPPKPHINRSEARPQASNSNSMLPQNALSKSIQLGTVSIRVLLPDMQKATNFEKMPVKQHTRLPDLRPPLRRDKPVRVAIPNHSARYIFPNPERSFIFIPRAQRPNQQGSRGRGRGHFSQYNSRRNSTYGGSVYTPSVAMSRRSSQAPDGVVSPTGSTMSRPPMGAPTGPARPVVKLPSAAQHYDGAVPLVQMPRTYSSGHGYPLPSQAVHENVASSIPMHQPRPQKTVSVASIESPAPIPFHAPQQQEQQPFHHQVPTQPNGQAAHQESQPMYSHSRQMSYHSQPTGGTPLSHIPERAINAQPFQPMAVPQQPYYPTYPMYYYPAADGRQDQFNPGSGMPPPAYMAQPQQGGYLIPMLMPAQQPPPAPPQENGAGGQQPGMYAHESNGMVYYYDPSALMPNGDGVSPAPYSVPGPGGMITPAPEGYFYPSQGMVYYGPP